MIDSNKPKKAEQIVRYLEHSGSHNAGEIGGCTKQEAAVLVGKKLAKLVYFDDAGVEITAQVEAAAKAKLEAAKKAAEESAKKAETEKPKA
jgi:hypothetical protein